MGLLRRLKHMLRPAPPAASPIVPGVHEVQGGPARGLRLLVNDRAPAFREMIAGTYDRFLWDAVDALPTPPRMVLDVGAHIGYHTLAFAHRFPQAQVVAFEPNPVNAERLQAQLPLNPGVAGRITVRTSALADAAGTMALHASTNIEDQTSSGGHLASVRPVLEPDVYRRAGFTDLTVPVERLDDVVRAAEWPHIDLIKIDVEGAEHLVLQGGRDTLRGHRPVLLIEVHSVACMLHVGELLHDLHYRIRLLQEDSARRAFIIATAE